MGLAKDAKGARRILTLAELRNLWALSETKLRRRWTRMSLAKDAKGAKRILRWPSFGAFGPLARHNSGGVGLDSDKIFTFCSIRYPGDAILEARFVEVDQEPELERNETQVIPGDFFIEIRHPKH